MSDHKPHPLRIQRKRTKGWRLPAGAVCVSRPSKWGNPHRAGRDEYSRICTVEAYRVHLERNPQLVEQAKAELRGKQLACWCRLDKPCHADVLAEVANQ